MSKLVDKVITWYKACPCHTCNSNRQYYAILGCDDGSVKSESCRDTCLEYKEWETNNE